MWPFSNHWDDLIDAQRFIPHSWTARVKGPFGKDGNLEGKGDFHLWSLQNYVKPTYLSYSCYLLVPLSAFPMTPSPKVWTSYMECPEEESPKVVREGGWKSLCNCHGGESWPSALLAQTDISVFSSLRPTHTRWKYYDFQAWLAFLTALMLEALRTCFCQATGQNTLST